MPLVTLNALEVNACVAQVVVVFSLGFVIVGVAIATAAVFTVRVALHPLTTPVVLR